MKIRTLLMATAFFYCTANSLAEPVEKVYQTYCADCHGDHLNGGFGPSLIDNYWKHGNDANDVANVIRNGVPDTDMRAWRDKLSDDVIRSLVIYIREQKFAAEKETLLQLSSSKDGVFDAAGYKFSLVNVTSAPGVFWSFVILPDKSILITERWGILYHLDGGKLVKVSATPKVWQAGQGGLLDVALHPNYLNNGWVYLTYSENVGAHENGKAAGMTAVARGKIVNERWVDNQKIFSVDPAMHLSSDYHFGSRMIFQNGYLLFGIGDRGQPNYAQDLSRPEGKIFRIYDDGRVPADNPFQGKPGALPAIWSYGHRNPQGLEFDENTGLLWESEHGPRGGDEVNIIEKGGNYGWPLATYGMNYDGTPIHGATERQGMIEPKHYWVPSIAVSGIRLYRGSVFPNWRNKILAGGLASEELHLLSLKGQTVTNDQILLKGQGRVRDVDIDKEGNIYLILNDGNDSSRLVRLQRKYLN